MCACSMPLPYIQLDMHVQSHSCPASRFCSAAQHQLLLHPVPECFHSTAGTFHSSHAVCRCVCVLILLHHSVVIGPVFSWLQAGTAMPAGSQHLMELQSRFWLPQTIVKMLKLLNAVKSCITAACKHLHHNLASTAQYPLAGFAGADNQPAVQPSTQHKQQESNGKEARQGTMLQTLHKPA